LRIVHCAKVAHEVQLGVILAEHSIETLHVNKGNAHFIGNKSMNHADVGVLAHLFLTENSLSLGQFPRTME